MGMRCIALAYPKPTLSWSNVHFCSDTSGESKSVWTTSTRIHSSMEYWHEILDSFTHQCSLMHPSVHWIRALTKFLCVYLEHLCLGIQSPHWLLGKTHWCSRSLVCLQYQVVNWLNLLSNLLHLHNDETNFCHQTKTCHKIYLNMLAWRLLALKLNWQIWSPVLCLVSKLIWDTASPNFAFIFSFIICSHHKNHAYIDEEFIWR